MTGLESLLTSSATKGMDLKKGIPMAPQPSELQGKKSFDQVIDQEVTNQEAPERADAPAEKPQAKTDLREKPKAPESEEDSKSPAEDALTGPVGLVAEPRMVQSESVSEQVAASSIEETVALAAMKIVAKEDLGTGQALPKASSDLLKDEKAISNETGLGQIPVELEDAEPLKDESELLQMVKKLMLENQDAPKLKDGPKVATDLNPIEKHQAGSKVMSDLAQSLDGVGELSATEVVPSVGQQTSDEASMNFQQDADLERGLQSADVDVKMDLKEFSDSLWIQSQLSGSKGEMGVLSARSITLDASANEVNQSVRSQLVDGMQPLVSRVLTTQDGGEMSLSLTPEHLGAVRIDLKVAGEMVNVRFHTETEMARSAIQSQVGELKQNLQSTGLRVDQVVVQSQSTQVADASEGQKNAFREHHQEPRHQHERQSSDQQNRRDASRDQFEFWSRQEFIDEGREVAA